MKLEMYRGDSPVWPFVAYKADGTRLDLTSGALFFTAKSSTRVTDANAVFQKTIGDGITVTNAAQGEFSVELDGSDTNGIYAPSYLKWDVQFVTTGNKAYTLLAGDILVKPDVTVNIS